MDKLSIQCPGCGSQFEITGENRGEKARCDRCKCKFIIDTNPVIIEKPQISLGSESIADKTKKLTDSELNIKGKTQYKKQKSVSLFFIIFMIFILLGGGYWLYINLEKQITPTNTGIILVEIEEAKSSDKSFSQLNENKTTQIKATGQSDSNLKENISGDDAERKEVVQRQSYRPDYSRMHPDIMQKMKTTAAGHYDLKTQIPKEIESGRNGFAIISTKKKLAALKNYSNYVKHKEKRGFKVYTVTEEDFAGGTGVKAALNIRKWLQKNYKKKNLLYVMFLGNPHPREGDTPMKKVSAPWNKINDILKAGSMAKYMKENPKYDSYDGAHPTDYFYVDLTGNWDKNNNGLYADAGDYGTGGIDGQPEVYVGRIPYYGIDVKYGNAKDVDKILARIIRFENEKGDLSWRHNIFYNGDVFYRDRGFYKNSMMHSGAEMNRHINRTSLYLEPEINKILGPDKNAKDVGGKYGFAYFQGHGFPFGGGGMSSSAAMKISDKYPKFYACGGCSVAMPEESNNMMYALLRSSGLGSVGGTRSVTGCSGNSWVKHQYYSRLFFGHSLGEMMWRMRGDQARDGHNIGATNFLINLYGDPSVVVMPRVYGSDLSISPGWKVRMSMVEGENPKRSTPYEVRNNTDTKQRFTVEFHNVFDIKKQSFDLAPGEFRKFSLKFKKNEFLTAGEHFFPITVSNKSETKEVGVLLTVYPKEIKVYASMDRQLLSSITDKQSKKTVQVMPKDIMTKGISRNAFKSSKFEGHVEGNKWSLRNNFTISFFFKRESDIKGTIDLFKSNASSVYLRNGKIGYWCTKTSFSVGSVSNQGIDSHLQTIKGKWHFISISVDRYNQIVKITLDDKTFKSKLNIDPVSEMVDSDLIVGRNPDPKNLYAIDELTIHNYLISNTEKKMLQNCLTAVTAFPIHNIAVNPTQINFKWEPGGKAKQFRVIVGKSSNLSSGTAYTSRSNEVSVKNLNDKSTYYWRVDVADNGKWIPSKLHSSFKTDSSVTPIKLDIPDGFFVPYTASIGVAGYAKNLSQFIGGLTPEVRKSLTFKKLAGPAWLSIYNDGLLFTNYGPKKTDQGINKFKVRITAPDGTKREIEFKILVVNNRSKWKVKGSSSQGDAYSGSRAVDGVIESLWHTPWSGNMPAFPHELIVNMGNSVKLKGFIYQPRCMGDFITHGRIKKYEFYVSKNGKTWGSPVAAGIFDNSDQLQTVKFKRSTPAMNFFKIRIISTYAGNVTTIPEIDVIFTL